MKKTLLLAGIVSTGLCSTGLVQAQSITVGQTTGVVYTDPTPDITVTADRPSATSVSYNLDVDADGRPDLAINSFVTASSYPSEYSSRVWALHTDAAIWTSPNGPLVVKLATSEVVEEVITASYPGGAWKDNTSYSGTILSQRLYNPAGGGVAGQWLAGVDGYVGVRVRSAGGAWRYGWVRIAVTSPGGPVTTVVKDYALSNTVLAQTSARAAGWQVYPVPATNWLTLKASAPTTGKLEVMDTCGRVLLTAPVTGATQKLDVSGLAAGIYTLRVTAASGSFTQRISKL